ncbi:hypothetical protein BDV10DRAFT_167508 [Aspergillus recurvatus]
MIDMHMHVLLLRYVHPFPFSPLGYTFLHFRSEQGGEVSTAGMYLYWCIAGCSSWLVLFRI